MKTKVILNPNAEHRNKILSALKKNKKIYGESYCPCSIIHNSSTVCKCQEFRDMILRNELGYCHCELFKIIEDNND